MISGGSPSRNLSDTRDILVAAALLPVAVACWAWGVVCANLCTAEHE